MKYLSIPGEPGAIVWQDDSGNSGVIREGDAGWEGYLQWLSDGNSTEPLRQKEIDPSAEEKVWRDAELALADIQLFAHGDEDPGAIATEEEWRAYRRALRAWPENPAFPDSTQRPVAPVAT